MSVIRVNNITNRSGSAGPTIAGVGIVSSTSYMVVPTGRTGQRYADEGENIVRDGLVLYLDAKHSYPSKTGIGTTTPSAVNTSPLSSTDVDVNTWYDMSGNGNDGELINRVGYGASFGGFLTLDGSNDFIRFTPFIIPNGSFTFESWALIRANTSECTLINQETSSPDTVTLLSGGNTSVGLGYRFLVRNSSSSTQLNMQAIISSHTTNQWHHWVGTYDNQTGTGVVYVDGSQIVTQTEPSSRNWSLTPSGTSPRCELGVSSGDRFLNGNIAITRIYNRALSAAEVSQNFNALRSRFGI